MRIHCIRVLWRVRESGMKLSFDSQQDTSLRAYPIHTSFPSASGPAFRWAGSWAVCPSTVLLWTDGTEEHWGSSLMKTQKLLSWRFRLPLTGCLWRDSIQDWGRVRAAAEKERLRCFGHGLGWEWWLWSQTVSRDGSALRAVPWDTKDQMAMHLSRGAVSASGDKKSG